MSVDKNQNRLHDQKIKDKFPMRNELTLQTWLNIPTTLTTKLQEYDGFTEQI